MSLGIFSSPSSQKGYMNNEDAIWTQRTLSPKQIYGFGQLIKYGEYLNSAQTRIVVDRIELLPPLDAGVPGFTALNK